MKSIKSISHSYVILPATTEDDDKSFVYLVARKGDL